MSHITTFFLGTVFGAYITQTYDIPNVTEGIDKLIQKIKEYEKKK
tara:strand:+ start:188 stop:322 length:135 start_codon:yes stop_codon:yes gene_type:complete